MRKPLSRNGDSRAAVSWEEGQKGALFREKMIPFSATRKRLSSCHCQEKEVEFGSRVGCKHPALASAGWRLQGGFPQKRMKPVFNNQQGSSHKATASSHETARVHRAVKPKQASSLLHSITFPYGDFLRNCLTFPITQAICSISRQDFEGFNSSSFCCQSTERHNDVNTVAAAAPRQEHAQGPPAIGSTGSPHKLTTWFTWALYKLNLYDYTFSQFLQLLSTLCTFSIINSYITLISGIRPQSKFNHP